jgi:hypothetical protein
LIDIDRFGTKRENRSETFSFFAIFASFAVKKIPGLIALPNPEK